MMKLYYASGSPWAWRVHLALEEKGVAYEADLITFSSGYLHTPEYLAMNPHGKVPLLTDGDLAIYESQAILEYVEEKHPEPPLLPGDAAERARVRMEEIECTTYMSEAFRGLAQVAFFTPEESRDPKTLADRRTDVAAELAKLEARFAARAGKYGDFLMGTRITRADTTWLPFVEIAGRAGVPVDAKAMTHVAAWLDRMRARPSYEKTYPPHWRKK
jgi:glutathione S-transferase